MTGPDVAATHSRRAGWRGSWRIALRLARRDAGRSKARTTLVAAMVGVPVLLIVSLSTLLHTNNISPQESLATTMGRAQAVVTTTGDARTPVIQNPHWSGWASEPVDDAASAPSRPWTLDQLQALTGGRLVPLWNGAPRLGTAGIALPISGVEIPLADPATHGMVRLRSGRLPQAPDEIAASAGLLRATHWKVGTTLTDLDSKASLRIVGTYSTLGMASSDRNVLGLPGGLHDPAEDDVSNTSFLLVRSTPVDWTDVTRLNSAGLEVSSRAVITNPPPNSALTPAQRDQAPDDSSNRAVVLLIIVAIGIEVVLLAGPAFAVGVRRRRRDLALLAATGSTPRDIRRSVLAQAGFIGVTSATAGALLGLPVAALAVPVLEHFGGGLGPFDWRWKELLSALVLGGLAAVLAALVPAAQAARNDVATVLAGRRGVLHSRRGWPLMGLALMGAGTAAALTKGTNPGGEFWVAGGTIVIVLGAVAATPWLVGQVGRLATRLPLPLRLATRDASRQRARTAPAVAAIMASVIGITALAIGFASDTKQGRRDYEPRTASGLATVGVPGPDALGSVESTIKAVLPGRPTYIGSDVEVPVTPSATGSDGTPDPNQAAPSAPTASNGAAGAVAAPDGTNDVLALVAPGCTARQAVDFTDTTAQHCSQDWQSSNSMGQFGAYTPDELAGFGVTLTDRQRQVLNDGGVLVAAPSVLHGGDQVVLTRFRLKSDGTPDRALNERTLPAAALPRPTSHTAFVALGVMTPATAQRLGLSVTPQTLAIGGPTLSSGQADRLNEKLTLLNSGVYVERGYHSPYLLILALLAGAGALVVLVGTLTATGLAMSEARPDLATLAAIGAPPRTRRYVASAQAMVIGLLGTVLGVGLGFVPGLAVTWPLTANSFTSPDVAQGAGTGPVIAIPWTLLLVIVVAVPLLAGLVTGLCTRSRLPMVRRLAT